MSHIRFKTLTLPAVTVRDSKLDNAAPGGTQLDKASLAARLSATNDTAINDWWSPSGAGQTRR